MRNVQGMLMYAGNDCEMPGGNEKSLLNALETGNEMRLGDLQRSAINMLNVIKRSEVFNIMRGKLDTAKDTTISDLKDQLNAAKDKLTELQNTPSVSPAELKKAQDELAAAKARLQTSSTFGRGGRRMAHSTPRVSWNPVSFVRTSKSAV